MHTQHLIRGYAPPLFQNCPAQNQNLTVPDKCVHVLKLESLRYRVEATIFCDIFVINQDGRKVLPRETTSCTTLETDHYQLAHHETSAHHMNFACSHHCISHLFQTQSRACKGNPVIIRNGTSLASPPYCFRLRPCRNRVIT